MGPLYAEPDDLDNLQLAWYRLRAMVNDRLPAVALRLWGVKAKVTPPGRGPGPRPT